MPLYDFLCECGYTGEHISSFNEDRLCPECGKKMKRLMPSTHGISMGAAGAYGYYDENLQCYIHTNKQRREEMRRQGVSEAYGKNWY